MSDSNPPRPGADGNVPYLDGWRGLAIACVLAGHFAGPTWIGLFGVQVFFVLSGLFMGRLLFIRQVGLATFFYRRFTRVLPAFWLFIGAMLCYSLWLQPRRYAVPPLELLGVLTFTRTYLSSLPHIWTELWPIGHTWSLSVEEHSYALLGAVALACGLLRMRRWTAAILACMTGALLLITLRDLPHLARNVVLMARTEYAALGIFASAAYGVVLHRARPRWSEAVPPALPILTFVAALACASRHPAIGLHVTLGPLLLAFTVHHLGRCPAWVTRALSGALPRWLGVCSFSIYLWQQPFYLAARRGALHPLPALAAALALAAASFYLFEDPLRKFLNARWAGRKPAVAGAKPAALP